MTATIAPGSNDVAWMTPTMEGMKARLSAFNSHATEILSQAKKSPRVTSVIRYAALDVQEAKVRREIKNLGGSGGPGGAGFQRNLELEAALDAITTSRKIEKIYDDLAIAYNLQESCINGAKAIMNNMAELKAQAATLNDQITSIRERDVTPELAKIPFLEDELRWLQEVRDVKMPQTSYDDRGDLAIRELNLLAAQGKYHGETSAAGMLARITAIEQQAASLLKLKDEALTDEALAYLQDLESQLAGINAQISKDLPGFEETCSLWPTIENTLGELFETSQIGVLSAVEIYQITTEGITPCFPG